MATIGQILYNFPDQNNPGYYKTTSIDGKTIIVHQGAIENSGSANSSINIFTPNKNNIFSINNISNITKLGIQAPSGTRFVLNGREIMVGVTGTYELDEESLAEITSFYFIPPMIYTRDDEASLDKLNESIEALNDNEAQRLTNMNSLPIPDNGELTEEVWSKYFELNTTFIQQYNQAYVNYLYAKNGIFTQAQGTLYNIMIDYQGDEGGNI